MSASADSFNFFIEGDRVIVADRDLFFYKRKGKVVRTIESSVEVILENNVTVILHFSKLTKPGILKEFSEKPKKKLRVKNAKKRR